MTLVFNNTATLWRVLSGKLCAELFEAINLVIAKWFLPCEDIVQLVILDEVVRCDV